MVVSASSSGTFFNETDIVELAVCGQAVALTCMQPIMIKKVASLMIRQNLCKRIGQPCEICLGRFWLINLVSLKRETLSFLLLNIGFWLFTYLTWFLVHSRIFFFYFCIIL